jgi:hypothetical protein
MQQAAQALNQAGATQSQAVAVLRQVVQNAAKEMIQATLQGSPGTVVLSGVQAGKERLPAIAIAENGTVTFGSGTVNWVGNNLEITDFVPK